MTNTTKRAMRTAVRAHRGQYRDGGDEYITHPMRVYSILKKQNLPEYICVAGLLHDVLEDTNFTPKQIERIAGKKVLNAVEAVTKHEGQDEGEFIEKTVIASRGDGLVLLLKLADRLDNIRDMGAWDKERRTRYKKRTVDMIVMFSFARINLDIKYWHVFFNLSKQIMSYCDNDFN